MPPALHSYGPFETVTSAPRVIVLQGLDPRSGRPVAIKVVGTLEENRSRSERVVDRVFNALTGLKSAGHPSVPRILEVGRIGGGAVFLVSEWVEGHVLSAPLDVPPQTVLNYATQVVSVLESMARYGLAHLNLRPNNLMVDSTGRVQLLGLASGYLVDSGSLQRSAPELSTQLASGGALWRCDLYSLASTACQLLGVKVEGAGTPVPFVGFPEDVRKELRGSEGLRLVLESALHRAATRRPASLGVFRRALLNCLEDADENRPIPLRPLPVEYRSETGSVRVKNSAPVLLFEAEGEEPETEESVSETVEGHLEEETASEDAVAEAAGVESLVAAPVDLDADLAEYVALGAAAGVPLAVPETAETYPRLVRTARPKTPEVLVARAGTPVESPGDETAEEERRPELVESELREDLPPRTADDPETTSGSDLETSAASDAGAIELGNAQVAGSEAKSPDEESPDEGSPDVESADDAGVLVASEESTDSQEAHDADSVASDEAPDEATAEDTNVDTDDQPEVASSMFKRGVPVPPGKLSATEEPHEESPQEFEEESPMPLEAREPTVPEEPSKEFVLGRDLVPEELLDGAAAAAEASMPEEPRQSDSEDLLTASIELDEGTAIGADSGTLHLEDVGVSRAPASEAPVGADTGAAGRDALEELLKNERPKIGAVPSAEDLLEEHQPEGDHGSDARRVVPLELVRSELDDENDDSDETLEQVLSGAALARPGESVSEESDEPSQTLSTRPSESLPRESVEEIHDDVREEVLREEVVREEVVPLTAGDVGQLSTRDIDEWSDSVDSVDDSPRAASFVGASAKKKGSGLFSANAIRGLFVVAAILWAAFALLWFRQEGSLGAGAADAPEAVAPVVAAAAAEPASPSTDQTAVTPAVEVAPAGELEPAPLVSSPPTSEQVEEAVRRWAAAWSRQDVGGYLSAYSLDFRPNNGVSRAQWASHRSDRVSAPSSIEVALEDLEVSVDGDRATAIFRQTYSSDTMSDQVVKTLTLASEGDDWKILTEVSRPVG